MTLTTFLTKKHSLKSFYLPFCITTPISIDFERFLYNHPFRVSAVENNLNIAESRFFSNLPLACLVAFSENLYMDDVRDSRRGFTAADCGQMLREFRRMKKIAPESCGVLMEPSGSTPNNGNNIENLEGTK
jgi:hypothetical protein